MFVSEMIAEIRNHGFDDLTDTQILSHINDTQEEVCTREPWPFMEATAAVTVDVNGKITSPTGIRAVTGIWDTAAGRKLMPNRLGTMRSKYPTSLTTGGNPFAYYKRGASYYVYPVPASSSLVIEYLALPAPLTLSPDVEPVLPNNHRILVVGALMRAFAMEDDPDNAQLNHQLFQERLAAARASWWQNQYDRTDVIQDVAGEFAEDYYMDWLE